jgi:glycine dehydrogenase subunit 2
MGRNAGTLLRDFHEARWDEPIIFEMSTEGERGILVPQPAPSLAMEVGEDFGIPEVLKRKQPPALPEIGQMRVNRHYMRLSQEILGDDVAIDIGQGTCTMKYSPKLQEHTANSNPKLIDVHPLQPESTIQGILHVYHEVARYLKSISGMDEFCFQAGGGAHAVFANASIVRAYWRDKGEAQTRDEVVTTIFSHPCDAGSPATAGYKVIDVMQDPVLGYPSLAAFKAALGPRTAAIFITNPEDTGIFNPNIRDYVDAAHEVGALAVYDQANVNGLMGVSRALEAGFDLIHYNLHKTFSSPHGGMGPGVGAFGVKQFLAKYLPVPKVRHDGKAYSLDWQGDEASIGQIRCFFGNSAVVLRAYMWMRALGPEGVREAAMCAVLNNQYMMKKMAQIKGITMYYAEGLRRIEQCRYSWEKLREDTGFGTDDVLRRMVDYSLEHYWESHHPHIVPEPCTLEPTESYSKEDIDEFVAILAKISDECYNQPDIIRNAPHNAPCHGIKNYYEEDPEKVICTWRQYQKRRSLEKESAAAVRTP